MEENNYAIIIENKIKGAPYQPHQIGRYIQKMLKHGCEIGKIYVVIIPHDCPNPMTYVDGMDNDIWTILACEDYAEVISKEEMKPRTVVIHKKLIDWLSKQCLVILPENEDVLKSAIIQFADYIKLLYNSRENQLFKIEMEELVKKEIFDSKDDLSMKNWEEVENLKNVLNRIQFEICCKEIEKWYNELRLDWPNLDLTFEKNDDEWVFYVDFKGVKCGCWSRLGSNSGKPYWGITNNKNGICKGIVNKIANKVKLPESKSDHNFFKWNYTTDGVAICKKIYQTAKKYERLFKEPAKG